MLLSERHPGLEATEIASALLGSRSEWSDHQTEIQPVPLFRSVIILKKENRVINPMSGEVAVFSEFPNAWVLEHELDFLDGRLPVTDSDGDGFNNYEEYLADTSPVSRDSRPSYLHKLDYLGAKHERYSVRYAARPDPSTVQLNGYTVHGRIRSTDLLKAGQTTRDQLFQVETISDEAVTALFTLKSEPVTLPKAETVTLTITSAKLELPVGKKESIVVEEGATFTLKAEPEDQFRLNEVTDKSCRVTNPKGESRTIPLLQVED